MFVERNLFDNTVRTWGSLGFVEKERDVRDVKGRKWGRSDMSGDDVRGKKRLYRGKGLTILEVVDG
jgi:hypothetical protein